MGSGPSIVWHADADSPSGNGLKSVVTDPIELDGFSSERFWVSFERYIRTRDKLPHEKAYESTVLQDGGLLAVNTYEIPGFADVRTYTVFNFHPEKDEVEFVHYASDNTLKQKATSNVLKLHHNPLRMEYWTDEFVSRSSGPLLQAIMKDLVGKMGSNAEVYADVDSPTEKGAKSVLTGPLDGATCSAEGFLDWTKQSLESSGATQQPDGMWLEASTSWFAPTIYRKYTFDTINNQVIALEYGPDSTCSPANHLSTSTTKVHKDPFRLEVWNVTTAGRRSNDGVKAFIEKLVEEVLKEYGKE